MTTQDEGPGTPGGEGRDCQDDKRLETFLKGKRIEQGPLKAKGKTGYVDSEHGKWKPIKGCQCGKRRQINLSPFFFACFLLDSASILY